jgi:hypothetical protein
VKARIKSEDRIASTRSKSSQKQWIWLLKSRRDI